MTLILTAGNADQFIQVSDRRLTFIGINKTEEEANKSIILICENGRFAIGFTGLAQAGRFKTRDWILTALNESGPPDFAADQIVKRFTDRATAEFKTNPNLKNLSPGDKRLTILITGYLYHHDPPAIALALVSNYKNIDNGTELPEALADFNYFLKSPEHPIADDFFVRYSVGASISVPQEDLVKIDELLKTRKPARAIVARLVELVRKLSADPRSMNVIGKQINSIFLPRAVNLSPESSYHTEVIKGQSVMPDIVMATKDIHMTVKDISIRSLDSSPMTGPKLKPNQPCFCGSGKKYKHCHGGPPTTENTWGMVFKPDK